jgi:hypothetical protein
MINWIITIIGLLFLLLGIGTFTQFFDFSIDQACLFIPLGLFMSLGGGFSLEKEYSIGFFATSTEEEMDDSHNPDIKEGINPWGTAATVVLSLLVFGILFLFWFLNQLGEAFS